MRVLQRVTDKWTLKAKAEPEDTCSQRLGDHYLPLQRTLSNWCLVGGQATDPRLDWRA